MINRFDKNLLSSFSSSTAVINIKERQTKKLKCMIFKSALTQMFMLIISFAIEKKKDENEMK